MKLTASGVANCAGTTVTLILPILVIDQDEHAAIAGFLDQFIGR